MGLDGVEMVMAVEESFGIVIADAEAEKVCTPRQLIDLVTSKLPGANNSACVTQITESSTPRSRAEVAEIVHKIVRDTLGVDEFSDDDDFVKDLGMD